ncbi:RNA polymerase sigma factor [Marinobacter litoralis]|uniref:RNA polymerase sigma factor n=1 Tax=Marinobacter litoralis TaxID=187981 RepID=UPI0018EC017A|nr:RNA polymerase sigma factor [Marinobacter litoralis]MBJ6138909.1 RNA polymerase sigma factor [Marinobacter litoralis]
MLMKSPAESLSPNTSVDPQTSEEELVKLAQRGEEVAVREIIRRLNPRLFRIARGILDNSAEAEEIVQETYLVAFTRIEEFRGDSKLSTWITKIALNAAKMRLRKRHPTQEYDSVSEQLHQTASVIAFPSASQRSPESEHGVTQFREWVESAVSELPSNLRIVFVLREAEGMAIADIAADLGLTVMTVKTRLFRARRHLKRLLESHIQGGFENVYSFDGARCAHMADSVVELLADVFRTTRSE